MHCMIDVYAFNGRTTFFRLKKSFIKSYLLTLRLVLSININYSHILINVKIVVIPVKKSSKKLQ